DVLYNVIEQAAARRQDEHCWKLAWDWAPLLNRRGRLHELLAVQRTAALAAGRLGDRDALAHVHCELGNVSGRLGDYRTADEHLRQPDAALWYCRRAVEMHGESGSRTGVADTLDSIACAHGQLGDYEQAIAHYQQALEQYQVFGDPQGEATSWLHLGDVQLAA